MSAFEILPATAARFDDVAKLLAPKNPESAVCWCLTYRLARRRTASSTRGSGRNACGRSVGAGPRLESSPTATGEVVGWSGVAPRSDLYAFSHGTKIPHLDTLPVWSVWCFKVRAGHRRTGVASALLEGAVEYARGRGAPVVEGYPVDNQGRKVDLTMGYVGTRSMFEKAGFTKAADTDSVSAGMPRVLMRLDLR